jgi:Phosphotransferase enzyme family
MCLANHSGWYQSLDWMMAMAAGTRVSRTTVPGTGIVVHDVTAIPADLEQQHAALRERVAQSGLYQDEIAEFSVARAEYPLIAARVGVVADLGSLTTDESRNIVRKVRLADGRLAVLKVMGHRREPGEGEVLAAWTAKGLPCVRPLEWGYGRTSWVLTGYLPLPSMPTAPDPAGRAADVRGLVRFIRAFHLSGAAVRGTRTWHDRLDAHLRWTLPLTRGQSLTEPADWEAKLAAAGGSALLHGDPAGSNVLVTGDGSFVLLDPPGAIRGPREADAGQIASHVGCAQAGDPAAKAAEVIALVDEAAAADRSLDPRLVALFAGLNLLVWAGYFLAGHGHPATDDAAGQEPVVAAETYLAASRSLVGRFRL